MFFKLTGHRTIEKRGSEVGEKQPMEVNTSGFWEIFHRMVLAVHNTVESKNESRAVLVLRLREHHATTTSTIIL